MFVFSTADEMPDALNAAFQVLFSKKLRHIQTASALRGG
jgi:hypothetical protein